MKLKATDANHFGKKVNLPDIGQVEVDKDGNIEGDFAAEHCHLIHNGNVGFEAIGLASKEAPAIGDDLDTMTLKEMRKICKDAGLPAKDWGKLDEDTLRAYVKEQVTFEEEQD